MNVEEYMDIACQGHLDLGWLLRGWRQKFICDLWDEYSQFRNEELLLTHPVSSFIEVLNFCTKESLVLSPCSAIC